MLPYDRNLKERSQQLRKGMTEAERKLWIHLRVKNVKGYRFYRQKPLGGYIADFYCPKAKLVIEVDGGQHLEAEHREYDRIRDEYLSGLGLTTLRFLNSDVLTNIDGVLDSIYRYLENLP